MGQHLESLAGLRILVVEDEVMIAMMLEDMLQDFGCQVEVASSIEAALKVIRDHRLDGVLLDMNIHGRTPVALADELVSRAVPFLLVTGYSGGSGDAPVIKAAPRLQKPFKESEMAQRMTETFAAPPAAQRNL